MTGNEEYISIGCGKVKYPNCIHMDIADNDFTSVDIVGDVRKIPFEKDRFKGVILSHVLEHLDICDHKQALIEIRRVLKENGEVYIEVPNLELACKYFVENFKGRRAYWYQCIYGRDNYQADVHKSGITEQYLTDLLFDCGYEHLRWLKLDVDEALIAVYAKKAKETPRGKL